MNPYQVMIPRKIVNPTSADGTMVYVRAVDGKMKGRHVWMHKDNHTYMWVSAKMPKYRITELASPIKSGTYKSHVYYLKTVSWGDRTGEYRVYYLSTNSGPEFDDIVNQFGPKAA